MTRDLTLDRATFRRACDPSKTLVFRNPEDKKYYIDFAAVRGNEVIAELKDTILDFFDVPTCALFTGHIGLLTLRLPINLLSLQTLRQNSLNHALS